ncbi:MAG: anti-sigma factor antagonist [Coriobacteriia bacterium]|nr:anti-sigma factor antagonist [Actinomycetota bacterium]MDZ4166813.1 anti-sigma factor antagonist [Coriobacteriia bacterium]
MKIVTEHAHDARVCVMRMQGEIDMTTAPDVRVALESAVNRGCINVVLDLERVSYADSSALGLIVWIDRLLEPKGGRLILAGADRNVARVLELSGLIGVGHTISAAADAAEAMAGLELSPVRAAPLWVRAFEFPAVPASLSVGRSEVCDVVERLALSEAALFDVRVAVGEALSNAIRHGSPGGEGDAVHVDVTAYPDRVSIEVRDRGSGFDGEAQTDGDPYASSGRGVMFMQALMDRVEFVRLAEGGTAVTLVKHL